MKDTPESERYLTIVLEDIRDQLKVLNENIVLHTKELSAELNQFKEEVRRWANVFMV